MGAGNSDGARTPPQKGVVVYERENFPRIPQRLLDLSPRKLDQRIVEPQLTWYCNRQGARTATANHELADEFDRIMSNYKGLMLLRSIPHI